VLVALTFAMLPRNWFVEPGAADPPAPARVIRYQPGVDWAPETR
jgi:hypothetical protein